MSNHESLPVYRQIVQDLLSRVESGRLKLGDRLPSLTDLCREYGVSRDTSVKVYRHLQSRGIVASRPGVGYYIDSTEIHRKKQVFLFFDSYRPYKEVLYNAFLSHLGNGDSVDLYFHHYNRHLFRSVITENLGRYTNFVIMPMLEQPEIQFMESLLPRYRVYILDTGWKEIGNRLPSVCQNFEKDIMEMLAGARDALRKYRQLDMVVPPPPTPSEKRITDAMKRGFRNFCVRYDMDGLVSDRLRFRTRPKTCYILHNDWDLIDLIEQGNQKQLQPGRDYGVISFNEVPLKRIVANGITTISTDFEAMGRRMAEMIQRNEKDSLKNPWKLNLRSSV